MRLINARNILETTIYDAQRMLREKKSSIEIVRYIDQRLKILTNKTPEYIKIDWNADSSYMIKGSDWTKLFEEINESLEKVFGGIN